MSTELDIVASEVSQVISRVEYESALELVREIQRAQRVFVTGEGRSGLMGKAFAMRLMHLGVASYVVGETICPSIQKGDLLCAISGSGTTGITLYVVGQARKVGARICAITAHSDSQLAKASDMVLLIPAATKKRTLGEVPTVQLLGSLFDQGAHLCLDAITLMLNAEKVKCHANLLSSHSNLE